MDELLGVSAGELEPEQQEALEQHCSTLRQGDLLHLHVFAILGAPQATLNEDTRAAAELAEPPVTSVERRMGSGLWAVVSQTCDIRRQVAKEPFLQVAPLYERGQAAWERAQQGASSRAGFAYPPLDGLEHPILDIRIIQTIEKTALAAQDIDPFDPGLDALFRTRLATWLARRFARHPFPNRLEEATLRRLRETIEKRARDASQPPGVLVDSLEGVWVSYDEANVDVLFLVRQDRAARSQLPAEELEGTLEEGAHKIMEAVVRRNESQGEPYRLSWQVATANRVPADAILYRYHPLDLEVG